MPDPTPDEVYRQAQAAEYGTFVANKPITIAGARAFNPGDPVPASHVERGVVSADDVDKITKGRAAAPTGSET
jgi:hypothetical protein